MIVVNTRVGARLHILRIASTVSLNFIDSYLFSLLFLFFFFFFSLRIFVGSDAIIT